jgi:hypothetical protein
MIHRKIENTLCDINELGVRVFDDILILLSKLSEVVREPEVTLSASDKKIQQ